MSDPFACQTCMISFPLPPATPFRWRRVCPSGEPDRPYFPQPHPSLYVYCVPHATARHELSHPPLASHSVALEAFLESRPWPFRGKPLWAPRKRASVFREGKRLRHGIVLARKPETLSCGALHDGVYCGILDVMITYSVSVQPQLRGN